MVPVRDGTFHSVIPFACYVRGLTHGRLGMDARRIGLACRSAVLGNRPVGGGARSAPRGLAAANDVRVQGYLDVLEDRLLLENPNVDQRCKGDWFSAGWQYQGGLERTANMHLVGDDVPVFLRSFLNGYAVDVIPETGTSSTNMRSTARPIRSSRRLLSSNASEIYW